jgi:hypothetical protein
MDFWTVLNTVTVGLCIVNAIMAAINNNWHSAIGWFVAGLGWFRIVMTA